MRRFRCQLFREINYRLGYVFMYFPSHISACLSKALMFISAWTHAQAQSLGTKVLDEDGLLELIRTKPGKKSKYEIAAEAEVSTRVFIAVVLFRRSFH